MTPDPTGERTEYAEGSRAASLLFACFVGALFLGLMAGLWALGLLAT